MESMEFGSVNHTIHLVDPKAARNLRISFSYAGPVLVGVGSKKFCMPYAKYICIFLHLQSWVKLRDSMHVAWNLEFENWVLRKKMHPFQSSLSFFDATLLWKADSWRRVPSGRRSFCFRFVSPATTGLEQHPSPRFILVTDVDVIRVVCTLSGKWM